MFYATGKKIEYNKKETALDAHTIHISAWITIAWCFEIETPPWLRPCFRNTEGNQAEATPHPREMGRHGDELSFYLASILGDESARVQCEERFAV